MSEPFTIISYFTPEYSEVAHTYLMPSIQNFHLKSDVRRIDSRGSWQKNTSYKAEFVLQMLEMHKTNVVFLDCDATICSYPQLFHEIPEEFNIACHILDRNKWYGREYLNRYELLSGTALFRYCPEVLKVVEKWCEECKRLYQVWEQQLLQKVLEENNVKVYNLPISYAYINTLPDGSAPLVKCEGPVIVHHQCSRTLKNLVK
jgi:hypothetical protein